MSKLCTIFLISLLFATFSNQNISANSQTVPKVPAVIAQSEFDYQGTHFVVQLIPSSDTIVRKVDATGGLFNEGDFALRSGVPAIVLRSESNVVGEITPMQDAEFVMHIPDPNWYAYGTSPIFLLTRKDKLPLIVLAQYGSSNGSYFRIFLIQQVAETFEIRPVEFSDMCYRDRQNILFGTDIKMLYDEINKRDYLTIEGYDNSLGASFKSLYIADYDEVQWRLVHHHSGVAPAENTDEEE